ncbi:retrovirus-related pol polyprotein from transposon TNT 1-94 [Tanacetum coccineum]
METMNVTFDELFVMAFEQRSSKPYENAKLRAQLFDKVSDQVDTTKDYESKDEAPEVIKTFLKRIIVLLQSPVIIIITDNGTEFKNQVLKEYFDSVGISHQASSVHVHLNKGVVERKKSNLVELLEQVDYLSCTYSYRLKRLLLHATLKTAPSFTPVDITNTIHFITQKTVYLLSTCYGLSVIQRMNREDLVSLVQKVIIGFSLVILLIHVLTDSKLGMMTNIVLATVFAPRTAPDASSTSSSSILQRNYNNSRHCTDTNNSSLEATIVRNSSHDVDELEQNQHMDHPLEQVIGEPSRPVLTRNQLRSDGDMCMYALTVSTVEPKNVKEAMTDPAWIESIKQSFFIQRLDVWCYLPPSGYQKTSYLKWLFKNKHDEENTVHPEQVTRWFESTQEEGIDLKNPSLQ